MTGPDATLAANRANATSRRRILETDALIAANAARANADTVTVNVAGFQAFVAHGLRLVPANLQRSPVGNGGDWQFQQDRRRRSMPRLNSTSTPLAPRLCDSRGFSMGMGTLLL